jgi:cyclopropane-fatty-acyl-phospholipid synthase
MGTLMATQVSASPGVDPAIKLSRDLLSALTAGSPRHFAVRFWDGSTWQPEGDLPPSFTLVLRHPGALRIMFWPLTSTVSFGEAYIFDDFDIEGDIFRFTDWLRHLVTSAQRHGIWNKLRLLKALLGLPKQCNPRSPGHAGKPTEGDHSMARDKEAISYAYDVPGEFYRLFLGDSMQYTCSYFANPEQDLDASQSDKMDYICKKLRLKAGEKYADIGCGWGNLLIHAAKNYDVHCVGITLAGKQAEWAERAIQEAGLAGRIKIVLCDYRDLKFENEFDKASSVGMGEHVGPENLPIFFRKVHQMLKPGGAYLHHCITLRPNTPYPRWTAFVRKYVFPNGELQTILNILTAAADAGLEIRDVENLRENYILTLTHWVRRLEGKHEEAVKLLDEVAYRIFRIYMAGAVLGFQSGVYNLHQSLLIKPNNGVSGVPLRRADWYA